MSELASVNLGRERDKRIIELVDAGGAFVREQIQTLVFPQHKGPQKCIQRLGKLVQRGKLRRVRFGASEQYIYYAGKWSQKSEHAVMVNWVYTAIMAQRKSWFNIRTFFREYTCKWDDERLVADALLVLENTTQKKLRPVFVECDRDPNRFDKVERYTEYFRSNTWTGQWWVTQDDDGTCIFPKVLVVTERPERVRRAIDRENEAGIRFAVATVEQVRQDVYRFL